MAGLWFVKVGDKVSKPLSPTALKQLIIEKKISNNAQISGDGINWEALSEVLHRQRKTKQTQSGDGGNSTETSEPSTPDHRLPGDQPKHNDPSKEPFGEASPSIRRLTRPLLTLICGGTALAVHVVPSVVYLASGGNVGAGVATATGWATFLIAICAGTAAVAFGVGSLVSSSKKPRALSSIQTVAGMTLGLIGLGISTSAFLGAVDVATPDSKMEESTQADSLPRYEIVWEEDDRHKRRMKNDPYFRRVHVRLFRPYTRQEVLNAAKEVYLSNKQEMDSLAIGTAEKKFLKILLYHSAAGYGEKFCALSVRATAPAQDSLPAWDGVDIEWGEEHNIGAID